MACQTRIGEQGISMSRTPSCRTASITALTTAGVDAMVPASPTPLTPSGLAVAGVSVRPVVNDGRSTADGTRYCGERAGEQSAGLVVFGLFVERLRDALGEPAVHLPVHDQAG